MTAEQQPFQCRHHHQRRDHRASEREGIGVGHRCENPPLDALEKKDRHQRRSLEEVAAHRRERGPHQIGAVVERYDLHAGWKDSMVEFLDPAVDSLEHKAGVGAAAEEHDPLDAVVVAPPSHSAPARCRSLNDIRHVMDVNRHRITGVDDDLADLGGIADHPHATDDEFLGTDAAVSTTGILVGHRNRVVDNIDGDSGGGQPDGIDADLVISFIASECDHIRHAGNAPQPPLNDEVLDCPEFLQRQRTAERVAVHLTDRGRLRPHLHRDPLGQDGIPDPLTDARPQFEVARPLLEGHRHQREAEHRHAPQIEKPRCAGEDPFQFHRYPPLHLLRGLSGIEPDNLDARIGNVWKSLYWQRAEAGSAIEAEEEGARRHHAARRTPGWRRRGQTSAGGRDLDGRRAVHLRWPGKGPPQRRMKSAPPHRARIRRRQRRMRTAGRRASARIRCRRSKQCAMPSRYFPSSDHRALGA